MTATPGGPNLPLSDAGAIALLPPNTMINWGCSLATSATVTAGTCDRSVSRIGAAAAAATGPAASASAKSSPLARNSSATPGSKVAADTAAAVEYRSAPAIRVTPPSVNVPSSCSTALLTAVVPPTTTMRPGFFFNDTATTE